MIMKRLLQVLFLGLFILQLNAQNVGIGTTSPDPSAKLDIQSTDSGILIPRLTAAQRLSISSPSDGLLVYDIDSSAFMYSNGFSWLMLATSMNSTPLVDRIEDVDMNTGVYVDKTNVNDDTIRFFAQGNEYVKIDPTGHIHLINTGGSIYIGQNAGRMDSWNDFHNVAIGTAALYNNENAEGIVAIGDSALYTNSEFGEGFNNTAIGSKALLKNSHGSENTAIGFNAMKFNDLGESNTAIGDSSMYSSYNGFFNTAVGDATLKSNTEGNFNTAIGVDALNKNTIGSENSALGYGTLISNTVGNANTAVGYEAANKNTTGFSNVAIGTGSLFTNTISSNLVAIGDSALYNNGDGAFEFEEAAVGNVAIGSKALYSNTIGAVNTAIGTKALYENISGSQNTATGVYALRKNTTGKLNTALGYETLFENTTGDDNTAMGANALFSNTTGKENTATGGYSLNQNTTGKNNTATGYQTLNNNTEGNNNTALGYQSALSNTTGNNNIAIGETSLYNNTTGSNIIAIGDSALFNTSTSLGNIAIGSKALKSNTTASNNTALGFEVLSNTSTGACNTATGFQAMKTNKTGSDNVAYGVGTLYENIDGSSNVAIGFNALHYNTSGTANIAIGESSSQNNKTGIYNVSVGNSSLENNKSGSGNTALGYNALKTPVNASFNTAVGYNSLVTNIIGGFNVAVGDSSLASNTAGFNNTAIGSRALQKNTTGNGNVAIGKNTLKSNTTASGLVAIGYETLQSNISGENLTAIGENALRSNTTGSGNVAIGDSSLASNTAGFNNTAIGSKSGKSNIAGQANVFIGNEAGYNELGSNKLYIENSKSDTALIYGDFDKDSLVINGTMDISDRLKLGDGIKAPRIGEIRWNQTLSDFEGFNGTEWLSLTQSKKQWGSDVVYEKQGFLASNGASNRLFGKSVSISGDWAVAGAPGHLGNHNCNVYFYKKYGENFYESQIISHPGSPGDFKLGKAVSIDGNYAAISSEMKIMGIWESGVYIYKKINDIWVIQDTIFSPDPTNSVFGNCISLKGEYIIVGDKYIDINSNLDQGRAYIFKRNGISWDHEASITASDGAANNYFGTSVSMYGDYVIIGAPGKTDSTGQAYIYKRNGTTWGSEVILTNSDSAPLDQFGASVDIHGDDVVVGAPGKIITQDTSAGKAYVFHRSGLTWGNEFILQIDNLVNKEEFGCSVGIFGDFIVIGARYRFYNKSEGTVSVFKKNGLTWKLYNTFVNTPFSLKSENGNLERFGSSVSISENDILVGAPGWCKNNSTFAKFQGAIYFLSK